MTYSVFATIPVSPEHMNAACAAVDAIVADTRAESGCLQFEPRRAADGSSTILIFEEWRDRAAFDFHHEQAYTKDVFTSYEGWLSGAPQLVQVKALKD